MKLNVYLIIYLENDVSRLVTGTGLEALWVILNVVVTEHCALNELKQISQKNELNAGW